jgi:hypothetical protein
MRREQQLALSRLVKLVARQVAGTLVPEDALLRDRLREFIGLDRDNFDKLCVEIVAMLADGWVWNARWREWRWPTDHGTRGRPAQPAFAPAWKLSRVELVVRLGREPTAIEIADYLRREPSLRDMAGINRWTKLESLTRRDRRLRNSVRPV